MSTRTLFSPGGLSHRIKALRSKRVLAAHAGAHLELSWPRGATCNCPYERLFEADPAHDVFEAWHAVRCSPLGDRTISTIRPWLPRKL